MKRFTATQLKLAGHSLQAIAFSLLCYSSSQGFEIDLENLGTTHPGFVINGTPFGSMTGISVKGAGDVNGDGLSDLIVGSVYENSKAGAAYVVFGKTDHHPIDLSNLGDGGFKLIGDQANDTTGVSVSSAGDVNGDGLADVIVGGWGANNNAGSSFIVFGKTDSADVELGNLGDQGFRVNGIAENDMSGWSVSGAGDVNGDGLSDVTIGTFYIEREPNKKGNQCYVVFGKKDHEDVELASLEAKGFIIEGFSEVDRNTSSTWVSGAGDVNGDGLDDLVIGCHLNFSESDTFINWGFVIFGKTNQDLVELDHLGEQGFELISEKNDNLRKGLFNTVARAGDLNGDGLSDILIGTDQSFSPDKNISYLIFGKKSTTPAQMDELEQSGFQIDGVSSSRNPNGVCSGAGDTNGDGIEELIFGVPSASISTRWAAGKSYVVSANQDFDDINLDGLSNSEIVINGASERDHSGIRVSGAGDVNGDGLADLIIGTPWPNHLTGESYVVFSPHPTRTVIPKFLSGGGTIYKSFARIGDAPRMPIGITGNGSNDSSPDSRTWINFEDGGTTASLQVVSLNRSNDAVSNLGLTANVHWKISTDRTDWSDADVTFKYLDTEISGIEENSLKIYQSAQLTGPWSRLQKQFVSDQKNQITGSVSAFNSYFALAGEPVKPIDLWIMY